MLRRLKEVEVTARKPDVSDAGREDLTLHYVPARNGIDGTER